MQITEVRIKLMDGGDDRLQAFCSITFDDCFVVRDLKIIEGTNGPFVAMPSRKLTAHCPQCRCKNHLRASFCNQCGARLQGDRAIKDHEGRTKLYADIAHPVNSGCREMIQDRVITEYRTELERAKQPGYVSRYDEDLYFDAGEDAVPAPKAAEFKPAEPRVPEPGAPQPGTTSGPRPSLEKPQVQPAEQQIRAPHKPPVRPAGPAQAPKTGDDFGAGIFH